jgi:hypothetical protein
MGVGKWRLEARLLDGLVGSRGCQPAEASRVRDALVTPPVRQPSREIEAVDLRDDADVELVAIGTFEGADPALARLQRAPEVRNALPDRRDDAHSGHDDARARGRTISRHANDPMLPLQMLCCSCVPINNTPRAATVM